MELAAFSIISDPRNDKNQVYSLDSLLLIIFASVLSGYDSVDEMCEFARLKLDWFNKFVKLERAPCPETLRYLLCSIKPQSLIDVFDEFAKTQKYCSDGDCIAIDGKTMKGTATSSTEALQVISAWSSQYGITLAALESKGKKNEIKTIPEVIDLLDARKAVITTDAMGCQKAIASKIIESKNDYVLQIKGNQRRLFNEIKAFHHLQCREGFDNVSIETYEEIDKGHGRLEQRKYTHFALTDWVDNKAEWRGLKSVILVERKRTIGVSIQEQSSWYISSLQVNARKAAKAIRSHWQVENPLHWWLDVVYGDDHSTLHSANGPLNLTMIKRYCMNLLTKDSTIKRKKHRVMASAVDDTFREKLLFG